MISDAYRGLLWKETRQIVPLIVMLVGVGVLLFSIWGIMGTDGRGVLAWGGKYITMIFPGLFAAGAGAILVGQEKENRTLWWNASMPIAPSTLIASKLVVAFVGWCAMWIVSLLSLPLLPSDVTLIDFTPETILPWIAHSLFLLAAGFYTAWRFQNAFSSLLVLVPIAMIPFAIHYVEVMIREIASGRRYYSPSETLPVIVAIHLGMFGVTVWLAIRAARKTLGPAEAIPVRSPDSGMTRTPLIVESLAMDEAPFRIPFSVLVWQSIHQSRRTWACLTLLVLAGTVSLAIFGHVRWAWNRELLQGALVGCCAAGLGGVCWLGVAAFAGDGSAKRMRFLADRGVSPTLAWLSCHAVAASLLSFVLVAYGIFTQSVINESFRFGDRFPVLSMGTLALLVAITYGISQWTSQTLRIVAANFVVAPVLSLVAVAWLTFAATQLRTPLGWILITVLVPYVATWWAMRWHMEDRGMPRMLGFGAVTAILFTLLPMAPAIQQVATWPRISSERIEDMLLESDSLVPTSAGESMMRQRSEGELPTEPPKDKQEVEAFVSQLEFAPESALETELQERENPRPLNVDAGILQDATNRLSYAVLNYEHSGDEDPDTKTLLASWLKILTVTAKRLRTSDRWKNQEAADAVEIELVQSLSRDSIVPLHDEPWLAPTIEMLADSNSRNEARRRAVLATWRTYHDNQTAGNPAQDSLYDPASLLPDMPVAIREYLIEDASHKLAALAIAMLDAGSAGRPTEPFRRGLHELVLGTRIPFKAGPYSDRLRATEISRAVMTDQTLGYPANQWFAAWETLPRQWLPSSSRSD